MVGFGSQGRSHTGAQEARRPWAGQHPGSPPDPRGKSPRRWGSWQGTAPQGQPPAPGRVEGYRSLSEAAWGAGAKAGL